MGRGVQIRNVATIQTRLFRFGSALCHIAPSGSLKKLLIAHPDPGLVHQQGFQHICSPPEPRQCACSAWLRSRCPPTSRKWLETVQAVSIVSHRRLIQRVTLDKPFPRCLSRAPISTITMTQPVAGWSLLRHLSSSLVVVLAWSTAPWGTPLLAQTELGACEELNAVGGQASVSKAIQFNNPLTVVFGRTNFNTDFTVTNVYQSYWVNFRSDEIHGPEPDQDAEQEQSVMGMEKDLFPVVSYLKFSDRTNLQVFGNKLLLDPGEYRRLGPFYPPQGKLVTEVNVKVGSSSQLQASGLRYTISVDGCFQGQDS